MREGKLCSHHQGRAAVLPSQPLDGWSTIMRRAIRAAGYRHCLCFHVTTRAQDTRAARHHDAVGHCRAARDGSARSA